MLDAILSSLCAVITAASGIGGIDLLGGGGQPAAFGDSRDQVTVTVAPAAPRVAPGGDLALAVVFDHAPGWHVYAGDRPLPDDYFITVIDIEAPEDAPFEVHNGFTQWPKSKEIDFFGDKLHVYAGRAVAYIPVTAHVDATPGRYPLTVRVGFQACDDQVCLQPTPHPKMDRAEWEPYGQTIEVEVVALGTSVANTADPALFADFDLGVFGRIRSGEAAPQVVPFDLFGVIKFDLDVSGFGGFALLLLVSAVGGFLLNLTPCVLPVIPLKIMSLSAHSSHRVETFTLGVFMSAGVIALWLGLGVAIAALSGFSSTNQLFQYPLFTIVIGVFIAAMAIGMCGLFAVRLPSVVYKIDPQHDSYGGSFLFGIMTAILSTPCTAPFMGAAAGFAVGLHPAKTLAIFAAIGGGMALPYQFLATFPHLVDRMPRSGPASVVIKEVMGLLMLAAAAYFVGTGVSGFLVDPPSPPSILYWWVVAAFGVAAGGWLLWRTLRITRFASRRIVFGGLGAMIIAVSAFIGVRLTDPGPIDWVYYTPQEFAAAKADNQVVVMEFTAEWCLNCKTLEKTVLYQDRLVDVLNGEGVVPIKVDLTGKAAEGNAMLNAAGRVMIPLLVVYRPDGTEVFKGDFYTVDQVLDAINEARTDQLSSRTP